ncbi:unnamed protein product [Bursaphelenchus okinawaensis]|uniref:BOS complex subunit TMEM147 n=1 Tax=Bursaphelenchus okinawaensis TaxID=465554 RepID=A0A811JQZ7_9BILA|nr:unnamed protein product [Bursaphelenchus okinawaensis]CAG9078647.1 unnamed protein product [Bursaphelenchus okinawaensis]
MTFFHFVNCCVLAFAPYFVVYKYSVLSEYSSLFQFLQAGGVYFFTQFCKLLTYATFFPAPDNFTASGFQHFLLNTGDLFDVVGLWLAINMATGRGEIRFLVSGFSWAFAHSVASHLLPLFIGARKMAFSWAYIQRGIEANADMAFYVGLATFVWLSKRNDKNNIYRIAMAFVLIGWAREGVLSFLQSQYNVVSWSLVISKVVYSVAYAASALTLSQLGIVITLKIMNLNVLVLLFVALSCMFVVSDARWGIGRGFGRMGGWGRRGGGFGRGFGRRGMGYGRGFGGYGRRGWYG